MSPVGKALWFIESNLSGRLTLIDVASNADVTPFHLARVFAETTGQSVMRYVWRRRLTRAAEALAYGSASVLQVAPDASYASHEAFGRAFRAEFGLTPTALRQSGALLTLTLTHPIQLRSIMPDRLSPPIIQVMPVRRFAGPVQRYDMQTRARIPAQWVTYNDDGTRVAGAVAGDYYGVCYGYSDEDSAFDYICGQEVPANATLPPGFAAVTLSGRYARFATKGHISTMQAVWGEIYGAWLARPEYRLRQGPSIEYYPPEFDGRSGDGGFEIWLPIEG